MPNEAITGGDVSKSAAQDERKMLDVDFGSDDKLDDKEDDKTDDDDKSDDELEEVKEVTDDGSLDDEEDDEEEKVTDDDSDDDDQDESELKADSVYQALKAKNKDIFKEIPELRHILFRERRYTEILPTIEDAEEAVEKASVLSKFEADISQGNSATLLDALKDNKEGLESFIGNFADTVQKLDNETYLKMMYPEFKKMLKAASKDDNEQIRLSAKNLNYFIFGDTDIEKASPSLGRKGKKDEGEDSITKRERAFEEKKYNSFHKDVSSTAESRALRLIRQPFKESGMSETMQDMLSEKIYKEVNKQLAQDKRHMGNMNNLWKKAKAEDFTTESKDSILNTFLSRAKVLIPKVRAKILADAKLSSKATESNGTKRTAIRVAPSGVTSNRALPENLKKDQIDWNKTSERDLLDGKVTMRK